MATFEEFVQAVQARTGLAWDGRRFAGTFLGFPAWTHIEERTETERRPVVNGAGAFGSFGDFGDFGQAAFEDVETARLYGYEFCVEVPSASFSGASLREDMSWRHDAVLHAHAAIGARVATGVAWIDGRFEVCANDPSFVARACAAPELQQLLERWAYTNLFWEGSRVLVELLDDGERLGSRFGAQSLVSGEIQLWGLSLAAAAARATG